MNLEFYNQHPTLLREISSTITSQKKIKKQLKVLKPKTFSCDNPNFVRLPRVNLDKQLNYFTRRLATLYYVFKIKTFTSKVETRSVFNW